MEGDRLNDGCKVHEILVYVEKKIDGLLNVLLYSSFKMRFMFLNRYSVWLNVIVLKSQQNFHNTKTNSDVFYFYFYEVKCEGKILNE